MRDDDYYMGHALELAERGRGLTSPNPMVGCVIGSADGSIVGEGYHHAAGKPHAEVIALEKAGERARGATLYVTLEPCSTQGRTPPCVDALLGAGLSRVVVAVSDPNPGHSGRGLRRLKDAGIQVVEGVLKERAARLNESFFKWITTGLPFVTAKWAMTADGRIASHEGVRTAISGDESIARVQKMRVESDAVMVGSGTAIADDPRLTARLEGARQPLRVVVDSSARIGPDSMIVRTARQIPSLVATTRKAAEVDRSLLADAGVEVLRLDEKDGRVDLRALMGVLGERAITTVLMEAGGRLSGAMFDAGLVDKAVVFTAPRLFGHGPPPVQADGLPPLRLEEVEVERVGEDVMITGYPRTEGAACSRG